MYAHKVKAKTDENANGNANKNENETLIITFAGIGVDAMKSPRFEFFNLIERKFNYIDRQYYVDVHYNLYHQGIEGITSNIEETVEYLRAEIEGYTNVIFVGVSAGGYAAILFGSLLNIQSVIAFKPPTKRLLLSPTIDEKYRDILPYVNNTTNYYLYTDESVKDVKNCHHSSHCLRMADKPNVHIVRKTVLDMKQMRDTHELYLILKKVVANK